MGTNANSDIETQHKFVITNGNILSLILLMRVSVWLFIKGSAPSLSFRQQLTEFRSKIIPVIGPTARPKNCVYVKYVT